MPRAGSSSLQSVLFGKRRRLAQHGLLYPAFDEAIVERSQYGLRYNHKLLERSARSWWLPGRFSELHGHVGRQILESDQPHVVISYEGWWHPDQAKLVRRTTSRLLQQSANIEPIIAAVVRDPVSFLYSLYKLDVLHGRTLAAFDDYWPRKLGDPRLKYTAIDRAFSSLYARPPIYMEFGKSSEEGKLVGTFLTAIGAGGVLKTARLGKFEGYRGPGGLYSESPFVCCYLLAARELGLKMIRSKRPAVMAAVERVVERGEFETEIGDLAIPVTKEARRNMEEVLAAEAQPFFAKYFAMDFRRPAKEDGEHQTTVDSRSPLGKALIKELQSDPMISS